ncbi:unnamed protein product, partial [Choristocarpus tenellus]
MAPTRRRSREDSDEEEEESHRSSKRPNVLYAEQEGVASGSEEGYGHAHSNGTRETSMTNKGQKGKSKGKGKGKEKGKGETTLLHPPEQDQHNINSHQDYSDGGNDGAGGGRGGGGEDEKDEEEEEDEDGAMMRKQRELMGDLEGDDMDEDQEEGTRNTRVTDKLNTTVTNCRKPLGAPESGLVSKIMVSNFMCHRKLSIHLCRQVNFIHGRNGSGKSAILAALQICLGARAKLTNRANKLDDLIR